MVFTKHMRLEAYEGPRWGRNLVCFPIIHVSLGRNRFVSESVECENGFVHQSPNRHLTVAHALEFVSGVQKLQLHDAGTFDGCCTHEFHQFNAGTKSATCRYQVINQKYPVALLDRTPGNTKRVLSSILLGILGAGDGVPVEESEGQGRLWEWGEPGIF